MTGTRPWPSIRSMSCIEQMARRTSATCRRTWFCCPAGQLSMMRSIVCAALFVWRVEKTRWPVSAAVMAVWIVSQSRISPTMMTSGSCRIALRSASWNDDGVGPDLALADGAEVVLEEVLDRVLDGDDVDRVPLGDPLDDAGERRRLARAGRAGDEDEARGVVAERVDDVGEVELGDARDRERDPPEDGRPAPALEEDVAAEARQPLDAVPDVDGVVRRQLVLLVRREDREDHVLDLFRG